MGETPTELPSSNSLPELPTSKKFKRFFQKPSKKKKYQHNYCRVYERLHHDIMEFSGELEYYNQKNREVFDRLIENISQLILHKFPGRKTIGLTAGLKIHVYGSYESGLAMPWSDIDIGLRPKNDDYYSQDILNEVFIIMGNFCLQLVLLFGS
jgi:DNA polymerase sigma